MYCYEASTFYMPTGEGSTARRMVRLTDHPNSQMRFSQVLVVLEFSNFKYIFGNTGLSTRKEIT